LKLLNVVTDAAASMTTDGGMTVEDLLQIGESFRSLSSQNVQFITVPNQPWPQNPNRVQFMQPRPVRCSRPLPGQDGAEGFREPDVPAASGSGGAQVLTTSPSKVKVKVLNGSGVHDIAVQAASGLTRRVST